jgi:hypothetical protein
MASRRDREMADDCAPMGTCSFCGTSPVPTLAPLKRRAKR